MFPFVSGITNLIRAAGSGLCAPTSSLKIRPEGEGATQFGDEERARLVNGGEERLFYRADRVM